MLKAISKQANGLLFNYSNLIFMRSRILGGILLALTFVNYNIALHGLIAWLSTIFLLKYLISINTRTAFYYFLTIVYLSGFQ